MNLRHATLDYIVMMRVAINAEDVAIAIANETLVFEKDQDSYAYAK